MNRDLRSSESPDVTSEACAWIAQLETGELSPADHEAFREWMRRSPRHAAEIRRLSRVSRDLNVLTGMAKPLRDAVATYEPIVRRRGRRRSLHIAATVVVALVVAAWVYLGSMVDAPPAAALEVATSVGDYRELTLADGTLVKLNTDSRIEVEYSSTERRVRLYSGEAFFNVAHDSDRPFRVDANGKSVRAVGTAFVVRLLRGDFGVTVVDGTVELTERTGIGADESGPAAPFQGDSGAAASRITLEAGQSISIPRTKERTVVTLSQRELKRRLSWQDGLHDFSNTPLEDVIKEISRYSPLEIEIADPALRKIRFGGIFRTGETQPVFDALQESFGIRVEYIDADTVRLTLAEKAPAQE